MIRWPKFWEHIPEKDRAPLRSIVAELLSSGVLFGDAGRERELFIIAREYEADLADYLVVAGLELFQDPNRPLFQARPIPSECGLMAKFTKDETLVVLTLWRIYDELRMEQASEAIVITANELDSRLKLYFENIAPPSENHFQRMLTKFRQRRFIRLQEDELKFGDSRIEILPTLARAIPFDSPADWTEYTGQFQKSDPAEEAPPA